MNNYIAVRYYVLVFCILFFGIHTFWNEILEKITDTTHEVLTDTENKHIAGSKKLDLGSLKFVPEKDNIAEVSVYNLSIVSVENGRATLSVDMASEGNDNSYPCLYVSIMRKDGTKNRFVVLSPDQYGKSGVLRKDSVRFDIELKQLDSSFVVTAFYQEPNA